MKRDNAVICLLLLPSILVLIILAFQWSIVDLVTPFLFEPIEGAAWVLLLVSTLISAILYTKGRSKWPMSYLPLMAFICVILCAEFVPFTSIWLDINFRIYKAEREKVAADIFSGKLRPNVTYNQSLITLPSSYSGLSTGGGEVVIYNFGNDSGVYFFTFRGILGRSSGYLFMSSDAVPSGDGIVEASKVAPHWFFVRTE